MGSRSSSKRKSKRDKISSKKKSRRKESKKRLVDSDSFSSSCNDDSLDLERRSSSRRNDRSPICTSIDSGLGPHFDLGYEEEVIPVDNPRRLKSIITFVNQPRDEEEENVWEKDPNKEEIVYDANDYPSPRSFDSNEGGSKIENIAGEAVHQSEKSRIDGGDRLPEGECMKNSEEIDTSAPVAALEGDVLESILRQKALENLRKLRVKPQARDTVKIHDETNVVTLSNTTVDIVHNKSIKIEQGASDAEEINQRTTEVVKLSGSEHVEKKPRIADLSVTQSHNESALLERSKEDKSSLSQAAEAEVVSGNDTSHVAGLAGDAKARSSNVELSSSIKPTSEEHSSEKAKDSSQFEQKTMTVIRGGEQVQVSYKVYIPKKAPGMVRRQLKR